MEGSEHVERMTMKSAVVVRRGEMDVNSHPRAGANRMQVIKDRIGALWMKQDLKQLLKDVFICVQKSKDCLN